MYLYLEAEPYCRMVHEIICLPAGRALSQAPFPFISLNTGIVIDGDLGSCYTFSIQPLQ